MLLCGQPGCLQSIKAEALLKYYKYPFADHKGNMIYLRPDKEETLFSLEYIKYISSEKEVSAKVSQV